MAFSSDDMYVSHQAAQFWDRIAAAGANVIENRGRYAGEDHATFSGRIFRLDAQEVQRLGRDLPALEANMRMIQFETYPEGRGLGEQ